MKQELKFRKKPSSERRVPAENFIISIRLSGGGGGGGGGGKKNQSSYKFQFGIIKTPTKKWPI